MSFDDYRQLCPDGTCIGLIGTDGRCKECGSVSPDAVRGPRTRGLDLESGGDDDSDSGDFDGDDRELCPDGACVGVIGNAGVCGECGKPADNAEQPAPEPTAAPATDDGTPGAEWDQRRLCPDGACIGVLDKDGRCPSCGTESS